MHSVNCFTARWNWQGIAATADSRVPRDVAGQRLKVRFEIVDKRFGVLAGPVKEDQVDPNRVQRGPYTVFLTLQVCCSVYSCMSVTLSCANLVSMGATPMQGMYGGCLIQEYV